MASHKSTSQAQNEHLNHKIHNKLHANDSIPLKTSWHGILVTGVQCEGTNTVQT